MHQQFCHDGFSHDKHEFGFVGADTHRYRDAQSLSTASIASRVNYLDSEFGTALSINLRRLTPYADVTYQVPLPGYANCQFGRWDPTSRRQVARFLERRHGVNTDALAGLVWCTQWLFSRCFLGCLTCCWGAVTPRVVDEHESRGDVAHVVGARYSPPLVARERVHLDPVRPHPRTGQGLSRAGPAVHKVPAWFRFVVRVSPAPWRGRGPGPTVASHPWRSAVCGG